MIALIESTSFQSVSFLKSYLKKRGMTRDSLGDIERLYDGIRDLDDGKYVFTSYDPKFFVIPCTDGKLDDIVLFGISAVSIDNKFQSITADWFSLQQDTKVLRFLRSEISPISYDTSKYREKKGLWKDYLDLVSRMKKVRTTRDIANVFDFIEGWKK